MDLKAQILQTFKSSKAQNQRINEGEKKNLPNESIIYFLIT